MVVTGGECASTGVLELTADDQPSSCRSVLLYELASFKKRTGINSASNFPDRPSWLLLSARQVVYSSKVHVSLCRMPCEAAQLEADAQDCVLPSVPR